MASPPSSPGEPPVIDPYEILGLERDATSDQVKSAYRRAALRSHPDKAASRSEEHQKAAHEAFQQVALAYAVLSDPARRRRYDATGSTAESIVDSDGFDWSAFYQAAFAEAVSADAIAAFSATYKHSDEERDDVLAAYVAGEGDLDRVYEDVMLSNVLDDDQRFRSLIDAAVAAGDVPAFPAYADETAATRRQRTRAAKSEAAEAEDYARELGVGEKLWGGSKGESKGDSKGKSDKGQSKKGKKGKKEDDQAGLAALIQQRQQSRAESFLDNLAEKYGATPKSKGKKGKKRAAVQDVEEEEPTEEAFQAAAARLKAKKRKSEK